MTLDARKKSEHRSAVVQLRQNHSARSHAAPAATVDVVVIGHTGQVGSELVASLARLKPTPGQPRLLLAEGINRSKHLLIDDDQTREHSRAAGALSELGRRLRSEEHTSELQSRGHLVCRLLLEKKNYPLKSTNSLT